MSSNIMFNRIIITLIQCFYWPLVDLQTEILYSCQSIRYLPPAFKEKKEYNYVLINQYKLMKRTIPLLSVVMQFSDLQNLTTWKWSRNNITAFLSMLFELWQATASLSNFISRLFGRACNFQTGHWIEHSGKAFPPCIYLSFLYHPPFHPPTCIRLPLRSNQSAPPTVYIYSYLVMKTNTFGNVKKSIFAAFWMRLFSGRSGTTHWNASQPASHPLIRLSAFNDRKLSFQLTPDNIYSQPKRHWFAYRNNFQLKFYAPITRSMNVSAGAGGVWVGSKAEEIIYYII